MPFILVSLSNKNCVKECIISYKFHLKGKNLSFRLSSFKKDNVLDIMISRRILL